MTIEHARIRVKRGHEAEFEQAIATAGATVFLRAEGFLGLALHRCIEEPDLYLCALEWRTLEDHTVTFREGPLFAEWRALVGPHFAEPPSVHHYEVIGAE